MTYHLPIKIRWNATTVCETLRSHCVDASVAGKRIRIRLPDGRGKATFARLFGFLSLHRARYVSMNYDPTKFIHNVNFEFPSPHTRAEMRCRDDIDSAMLQFGCLECGDREIAAKYCPENTTLTDLFNELDRLNDELSKWVQMQDFEKASVQQAEQDLIRNRIDAILFSSVAKQW